MLTEQQNPILSKNSFVYRCMERDNRGPGNFEFSTRMRNKIQVSIQSNPPYPFNMSKEEERPVDLEVQNPLAKGAIDICSPDPNQFISNIFTILKKDGGRRPVVNMRELNQFPEYLLFKMEDILWRGDYMTKLDLQDAYLTIPVSPKSKIYLSFFLLYCLVYLQLFTHDLQ